MYHEFVTTCVDYTIVQRFDNRCAYKYHSRNSRLAFVLGAPCLAPPVGLRRGLSPRMAAIALRYVSDLGARVCVSPFSLPPSILLFSLWSHHGRAARNGSRSSTPRQEMRRLLGMATSQCLRNSTKRTLAVSLRDNTLSSSSWRRWRNQPEVLPSARSAAAVTRLATQDRSLFL